MGSLFIFPYFPLSSPYLPFISPHLPLSSLIFPYLLHYLPFGFYSIVPFLSSPWPLIIHYNPSKYLKWNILHYGNVCSFIACNPLNEFFFCVDKRVSLNILLATGNVRTLLIRQLLTDGLYFSKSICFKNVLGIPLTASLVISERLCTLRLN